MPNEHPFMQLERAVRGHMLSEMYIKCKDNSVVFSKKQLTNEACFT